MSVYLPTQTQPIGTSSGQWDRAWYEWAWRLTNAVNAGGGGGGGAPTGASYVVLGLDAGLTAERVLTAGSGISITDGGPGTTVTIASTVTPGAPSGAQYVTLALDGGLSAERVLTAGNAISITDGGANGPVTLDATLFTSADDGIVPASGGGTANFLRADGTWAAPPGGGGTVSGTATIDFGGSPTSETDVASVSVADAGIGAASEVTVSLQYAATADHSADEALISNVQLLPGAITAGVGFEIRGYCPDQTWGQYAVHWVRN